MKRTFKQIITEALSLFWRDVKEAKWVIIVVITYFVFMELFVGGMCPAVLLSGYPCPACGMTRALKHVLHFQFTAAWNMHPFIYLFIGMAVFTCINRYLMKKKLPKGFKWFLVSAFSAMLIFYAWRMIKYFPGEPPMSYYSRNLCNFLSTMIECL